MISVWPSVWGCLDVDRANCVSRSCAKDFHTVLVHLGSLSPTIVRGNPKTLTIHLNSKAAVSSADTSEVVVMNCANFVSLSTTTKMAFLSCEFGNPVIKSSVMVSKGLGGIARGCK